MYEQKYTIDVRKLALYMKVTEIISGRSILLFINSRNYN